MASKRTLSLRRLLVTGLLTLLPIWLTWVVLSFVFGLLSNISQPWVQPLLSKLAHESPALSWLQQSLVTGAVALFGTLLVILLVGWLAEHLVGQALLQWFEAVVARIPLANSVYSGARKLLDTVQTSPDGTQRVVLVEFPHPGMKTVGLVTRVFHDSNTGEELAAVFIPTTPNPTGGYLEIVPVQNLVATNWSVDQAMSFIISGGAVAPDSIPYRKVE
ncbi:DUF502 domain-containing protein [Solilutibacter silvestris]|uniref:DUF502 domain-containing protein n=1 Tax=Solilutibacter silvestris TaxID=1645665 RepID=A0A2K1PXV5_9GAMM|nr:DUF502 domain-containing protein [Lysobacter silvestris]PNS07624.1 hypothetical protein Lysil_1800 [Lysobacter silvestris]